jgi:Leucine-rich repeat (LRR) protein
VCRLAFSYASNRFYTPCPSRAQFRRNHLTGQIPSELALLSNLEELDLSYNNFRGSFPTQMNLLPNLRELELSRAERGGLSGSIPALAGLQSLAVLGLGHNNFQGSIPELFLSGVTDHSRNMSVGLGYNSLTGMVPHHLDVFVSMILELEGNSISDLPSLFCDNSQWQAGYVGHALHGCNAILCPPGTWNMNGRETNGSLCEPCDGIEVYGATRCSEASGSAQGNASVSTAQLEQKILDMLYAATNGKDWTAPHNGWINSPVCRREGVSCDDQGNVEALRLNNFGMTGEIPTEIFQLSKNRLLGLTDNNVDLRFDGIERSIALETLLLSNTKVRSLAGLQHAPPTLKALHLARNDLEGPFPLSFLGLQGLNKVFRKCNMLLLLCLTLSLPATCSHSIEFALFLDGDQSTKTNSLVPFQRTSNC